MTSRETVMIDKKAFLHALSALEGADPHNPLETNAQIAFYALGVLNVAAAFAGLGGRADTSVPDRDGTQVPFG